jgi:hypothetical protein
MADTPQQDATNAPDDALPVAAPQGGYSAPTKLINTADDLQQYLKSNACRQYLNWLQGVNDAVKGKKLTANDYVISPVRFSHLCIFERTLNPIE